MSEASVENLKVLEVAELLNVSRGAVHLMMERGEIQFRKFGQRIVRIPKSEVDRILSESVRPRTQEVES